MEVKNQLKTRAVSAFSVIFMCWRRGRDSNPRGLAPKLISRYVERQKPLISPHKSLYLPYSEACINGLFSYRVIYAQHLFITCLLKSGQQSGNNRATGQQLNSPPPHGVKANERGFVFMKRNRVQAAHRKQ